MAEPNKIKHLRKIIEFTSDPDSKSDKETIRQLKAMEEIVKLHKSFGGKRTINFRL